jgi:formylglycine-generating enzyme required for sulfatase activity
MYYVSWNDIQSYLTKLNQLTGKNYRLPTEAEWEYAAKGGQSTHNYTYSGSNTIGDVAWYTNNSDGKTYEVGTKTANELGIYDMTGNVWEWCNDWYGDTYPSGTNNPTGPSSGVNRVGRGGSWDYEATSCRVSSRYGRNPGNRGINAGFRLVLVQ